MTLLFAIFIGFILKLVISTDLPGKSYIISTCEFGDVVQNENVKCSCSQKGVYQCSYKETNPDKNATFADKDNGETILFCEANKMYSLDRLSCICNANGTWPHSKCGHVLKSLPEYNIAKLTCEPNSYLTVDCNICRCDLNGAIDTKHCTRNNCTQNDVALEKRRSTSENKLYGDCERRNWYSLAPCQFCYCVNQNKLICNTGSHIVSNQMYLQLGAYNLHVCGKNLVNDLTDLVHDNEKSLRQRKEPIEDSIENDSTPAQEPKITPKKAQPKESKSHQDDSVKKRSPSKANSENDETDDTDSDDFDSNKQDVVKPTLNKKNDNPPIRGVTIIPYSNESEENQESKETPPTEKPKAVRQGDLTNENYSNDISEHGDDLDGVLSIPALNKLKMAKSLTPAQEPLPMPLPMPQPQQPQGIQLQNSQLPSQFEFNLPMVLNKVFKLAVRKSMVTINKNDTCVPGSIDVVKCNTCFCLKNGKMLCTNSKCT